MLLAISLFLLFKISIKLENATIETADISADLFHKRQATSAQIKCWHYFLCVFFPVFFSELSIFSATARGKPSLVIWSITVLFRAKFWNLYESKYIRDNKDSIKNEGSQHGIFRVSGSQSIFLCFVNCVWLINKAAVLSVIKPLKLSSVIGLMVIKFPQCMCISRILNFSWCFLLVVAVQCVCFEGICSDFISSHILPTL